MESQHAYAVLGVAPGSDLRTIEAAYARLLAQYPADRAPDQFARILAAYEAVKGGAPVTAAPAPAPTFAPITDAGALQAHFEQLFDQKRFGEIWGELSNPQFVETARSSASLAGVALRAIGAMVWHVPAAIGFVAPFATLPAEYGLAPLYQHVQMEAAIAARWNAAMSQGALWDGTSTPETLVNLVGEPLLASPGRRRQTFAEVIGLLADPHTFLATIDRLVAVDPELVRLVLQRLRGESPLWGPSALAPLSPEVRDRLRELMMGIRKRSITRYFGTPILVTLIVIGVVLGLLFAVAVFPSADADNADMVFYGAMIIGALPAGIFISIRDKMTRNEWTRRMRGEVAAVIAHLGIQADVVSAWLRNSPRLAGRMKLHIPTIENDLGLMLLGAVSAVAQEHARNQAGNVGIPAVPH